MGKPDNTMVQIPLFIYNNLYIAVERTFSGGSPFSGNVSVEEARSRTRFSCASSSICLRSESGISFKMKIYT